jgi:hypothetical protein
MPSIWRSLKPVASSATWQSSVNSSMTMYTSSGLHQAAAAAAAAAAKFTVWVLGDISMAKAIEASTWAPLGDTYCCCVHNNSAQVRTCARADCRHA